MFREAWDFIEYVWKDDWVGKLAVLFLALVLTALVVLPFAIYYDHLDMVAHHCVETSASRENTYIQYIYGDKGQIISAFPVTTTEYLYTCDDHSRWR